MTNGRPRLGRGLSALLGDVDPAAANAARDVPAAATSPASPPTEVEVAPVAANTNAPSMGADPSGKATESQSGGQGDASVRVVPLAALQRNPDQPRKRFDARELDELATSIKEKGLLQPILVRPLPGAQDTFQIVAGERRWRASQAAGLHQVPVLVRDLSDRAVLEISIIENVQRQDLNAIEEAKGYQALIDQFGHTQDAIAKAIGKSRSHVANTLRLLALPPRVVDMVYESRLTAGHARAIAAAPDPEALAIKILEGGLSVRDAENLARSAQERAGGGASSARNPAKDANTLALEKAVAEALGLDIEIKHRGEAGGEVKVRYLSLEQLEDVCRRLQRA